MKVVFADVYKKDRSVTKQDSSKLMWFVAFYVDEDSKMKDVPEKEETIGANLFEKPEYYKEHEIEILAMVVRWKTASWSEAKYMLENWRARIDKRDDFLSEQSYSFDQYFEGKLVKGTATDLDRMEANTPKLWSDFFKITAELERENLEGDSLGGTEDSFLD